MQCHKPCLIGIFIMHIMNDIHRVYIKLSHIFQHFIIIGLDLFIIEHVIFYSVNTGNHRHSFFLINSSVYCIKERFCQVASRAEKLHLFAYLHRRNTASYSIIISIGIPHQVIILILDSAAFHGHPDAILFKILRKAF
ncbi:hypothetical protein SDC9_177754 [bioreactor metagenome]|uniref:Uncharacterized protein n=1 Tax=bioreactor metagenome TaxID=1076179 RepID=A0A645GTV5_9ZZZZ